MNPKVLSYLPVCLAFVAALAFLAACNPLKPDLVDLSRGRIVKAAILADYDNRSLNVLLAPRTPLSQALARAIAERGRGLEDARTTFVPVEGFSDDTLAAARRAVPDATHAIVVRAALVKASSVEPARMDICATTDKMGKCEFGWIPEKRELGEADAHVEVFDLSSGHAVFRADTKTTKRRILVDDRNAESAAVSVASRVLFALRDAKLI